jgi:two-component system NtrC family sensor kinase
MDAIFQNLGDGVIILDKYNRIILVNQPIELAFKVDPKNLAGQPLDQAIPHPDLISLLYHTTAEASRIQEVNLEDDRVLMARSTIIPDIGLAITLQDISYLKELERVKNDFVHNVSHDLRSPLTSVLGYAELIGRTGPLNDDQRDFLSRLQSSVQQITALVNDLLDIRRMEAGFDTRRETVNIGTLLDQTLNILHGQIDNKHLHVSINKEENLPTFKANPLRLRQLLDNLLGNAVKYTQANGDVKIDLRHEDGLMILSIADSGPGISPTDQLHIFEKFYRGANVPDGVVGTGLGLAIVKSIVDSHEGRIWVESALGQGSTFFVVLPIDG